MREMLQGLLDLVFPPKCRICKTKSAKIICDACFRDFPRITGSICSRCGKPCQRAVDECRECAGKAFNFTLARSGGNYKGPLKEAIHELKYKNGKRIAPYLARFVEDSISDLLHDIDSIAFVPLAKRKQAKRGYNQSQLIAEELAMRIDKPLYGGLTKIKDIYEQNKLGLAERPRNVKGAFVAKNPVSGTVLLIDDVYTTGSTVNECARVLRDSGASKVFVLTIARTPLTKV